MLLWLLVSCAIVTKQADFDVDLPLFDAEDGDAEAPDELPMELKVYDARTDWTLPAYLDVEDWEPCSSPTTCCAPKGAMASSRST